MKIFIKYSKYFSSILFLLTIIIIALVFNRKIEGFSNGFNWTALIDNTVDKCKKDYNENKNIPNPLESSNTRLCTVPNCHTFKGVENSWNRYIVNRTRLKNDNNDNDNDNDNGNYRVTVPPKQFLSYNIVSPSCCEYTQDYTSSSGCVCVTPQQKQLLRFRYGNKS